MNMKLLKELQLELFELSLVLEESDFDWKEFRTLKGQQAALDYGFTRTVHASHYAAKEPPQSQVNQAAATRQTAATRRPGKPVAAHATDSTRPMRAAGAGGR